MAEKQEIIAAMRVMMMAAKIMVPATEVVTTVCMGKIASRGWVWLVRYILG